MLSYNQPNYDDKARQIEVNLPLSDRYSIFQALF